MSRDFEKWWADHRPEGMLAMLEPHLKTLASHAFEAGMKAQKVEENKGKTVDELMPETNLGDADAILFSSPKLKEEDPQVKIQKDIVEKYGWKALEDMTKRTKQKIVIEKHG